MARALRLTILTAFILQLAACGSGGGGGGGKNDAKPTDPASQFSGLFLRTKALEDYQTTNDGVGFCSKVVAHSGLHGVTPVETRSDLLSIGKDGKVSRYSIDANDKDAKMPIGQIDGDGNFTLAAAYGKQYPLQQARSNNLENGLFTRSKDEEKQLVFFNNRSWGTKTYTPVKKALAEDYLTAVANCGTTLLQRDYTADRVKYYPPPKAIE